MQFFSGIFSVDDFYQGAGYVDSTLQKTTVPEMNQDEVHSMCWNVSGSVTQNRQPSVALDNRIKGHAQFVLSLHLAAALIAAIHTLNLCIYNTINSHIIIPFMLPLPFAPPSRPPWAITGSGSRLSLLLVSLSFLLYCQHKKAKLHALKHAVFLTKNLI